MTIPIDRRVEQSIIIKEEVTTFDPARPTSKLIYHFTQRLLKDNERELQSEI